MLEAKELLRQENIEHKDVSSDRHRSDKYQCEWKTAAGNKYQNFLISINVNKARKFYFLVVHAEEDNENAEEWLDAVPDCEPANSCQII